jgi:hypothetical protein
MVVISWCSSDSVVVLIVCDPDGSNKRVRVVDLLDVKTPVERVSASVEPVDASIGAVHD